MNFERIEVPREGAPIEFRAGELAVPPNPIIPLIEGDGIGPEIVRTAVRVLAASVERAYGGERRLIWMPIAAGAAALDRYGTPLPDETLAAIRQFRVALKGPLTTQVAGGFRSLNVTIRQKLDLYACVRPVRWVRGVPSPVRRPDRMNIVIFRENMEDVYAGYEWKRGSPEAMRVIGFLNDAMGTHIAPDSGIGLKPMSETASKRLVRAAIRYALRRGRRSVTLVHKGNIMKYTEGAFRDWGYEVAREEFRERTMTERDAIERHGGSPPEGTVVMKDVIADSMFQQILTRTEEYDVVALPNLNGDYLSDAAAAQVGGIGMAPGGNIGDGIAVFEATHGSAPKYAGEDKMNPGSLILSGCMMLEYVGWDDAAQMIYRALEDTIQQKRVTYDLARLMEGALLLRCSEFGSAVIENLH